MIFLVVHVNAIIYCHGPISERFLLMRKERSVCLPNSQILTGENVIKIVQYIFLRNKHNVFVKLNAHKHDHIQL